MDSSGTSMGNPEECSECQYSFRACQCKSCLKCGTPFMKYYGTGIVKGRSHCRTCNSPVCIACIVLVKDHHKVCTRCHLWQREQEITTEKALSAICEEKFGEVQEEISKLSHLKTAQKRDLSMLDAAKRGKDHLVVTLLDMGCSVNITANTFLSLPNIKLPNIRMQQWRIRILDASNSSPLFYAAEGGHLSCVALLLEKGADIKAVNNVGWSPLHAVAWKGTTDKHIECAEFLLEMGCNVFQESDSSETATDVAQRCCAKKEIVQILKAAEVEVALSELNKKLNTLIAFAPSSKERQLHRLVTTLINRAKEKNDIEPKNDNSPIEKENEDGSNVTLLEKSKSAVKSFCYKCLGDVDSSNEETDKRLVHNTTSDNTKSVDDGEYERTLQERDEWESRSRKLMQSMANSNKEYNKTIEELRNDIKRLNEEVEVISSKCEATYTNKISKLNQEHEIALTNMEERLQESEAAFLDLLHANNSIKVTWVPDHVIKACQHCTSPFSKTNRKHHCRCCGRVFCSTCTKNKKKLEMFGYTKPVRVCSNCFSISDEIFIENSL